MSDEIESKTQNNELVTSLASKTSSSLKAFIEFDKNVLMAFIKFLISSQSLSLAAAVASAIAAWKSYETGKISNDLQIASRDPVFALEKYAPEQDFNVYESRTEGMRVVNYGNTPRIIHRIEMRQIWIIQYFDESKKPHQWRVCVVPVDCYWGINDIKPKHPYTGVISQEYFPGNLWCQFNADRWCRENGLLMTWKTLSCVDYTPMLGNRRTDFYIGDEVTDGDGYSNYVKQISHEFRVCVFVPSNRLDSVTNRLVKIKRHLMSCEN